MTETYFKKPDILSSIPLDAHAVIEASAGTGKTFTIEHLFVELLLRRKISVENILVLTYTEKAAGELRSRVRRIMEQVLTSGSSTPPNLGSYWSIWDSDRITLEQSLFSFDRAPIHTIHGFFQRVITENAFNSGRLFNQTLVDSRALFSDVFKKVLREKLAADSSLITYLTYWSDVIGKGVAELEEFLHSCHRMKCDISPLFDPGLLKKHIAKIAEILGRVDTLNCLGGACKSNKVHGGTTKSLLAKVGMLGIAAMRFSGDGDILSFLGIVEDADMPYILEKIEGARSCMRNVDELIEDIVALNSLILSPESAIAQTILPVVRERFYSEKKEHGYYDFDDMILFLLEGLNGPQGSALLKALRSRYRYALIDESQDTDNVQWDIFKKIFIESNRDNFIYLIGDPKQAIYGFRGADVYTYLSAKATICSQKPAVSLCYNFRSTGPLVNAFNLIFDQAASKPFFSGRILYDAPVKCGRESLVASDAAGYSVVPVKIVRVTPGGKTVYAGEYREKMGRYIAAEIGMILAHDAGTILVGEEDDPTPVSPRDIFILTRKESEGREVSEYLREAGIPFAFYKQDGLFQTREAEDIRDVLAAVEKPFDQPRRFKAWLTPFFGLDLEGLLSCKDLPETEQITRRLIEWHSLARKRRYQQLFSRILDESGLIRRELFLRDTERELTNYLHIFEILLEEVSTSLCDISELVGAMNGFINQTRNPARDDGNVQRLETEKEAVQIMTMHKSKGLEASVVFLYGGFTKPPSSSRVTFHENDKRLLFIGSPPAAISGIVQSERDEEDQRLLYVAATRAKARVYLPYIAASELGSYMTGPYVTMNSRINDLLASPSRDNALLAVEDAAIHSFPGINLQNEREPGERVFLSWKPKLQDNLLGQDLDLSILDTLRKKHSGFEVTSYSRIKRLTGTYESATEERESPDEIDRSAHGVGSESEGVGGAEYGSAVHRVFEMLPFKTLTGISFAEWRERSYIIELFAEALTSKGIDLRYLTYSQQLVYNALVSNARLGDGRIIPGLCSVENLLKEVEFVYPYPENMHPRLSEIPSGDFSIERGYVKGFIDLLFEFEGRIFFSDWKTDIIADYSSAAITKHFEAHYVVQTKLYLIALAKMLKLHTKQTYEEKFGGIVYCFIRGMQPEGDGEAGILYRRPSWEDLLSYEEELISNNEYIGGEAQ